MSSYTGVTHCGCKVTVEVYTNTCYCGDYCYCYDSSGEAEDVEIEYCDTHLGL